MSRIILTLILFFGLLAVAGPQYEAQDQCSGDIPGTILKYYKSRPSNDSEDVANMSKTIRCWMGTVPDSTRRPTPNAIIYDEQFQKIAGVLGNRNSLASDFADSFESKISQIDSAVAKGRAAIPKNGSNSNIPLSTTITEDHKRQIESLLASNPNVGPIRSVDSSNVTGPALFICYDGPQGRENRVLSFKLKGDKYFSEQVPFEYNGNKQQAIRSEVSTNTYSNESVGYEKSGDTCRVKVSDFTTFIINQRDASVKVVTVNDRVKTSGFECKIPWEKGKDFFKSNCRKPAESDLYTTTFPSTAPAKGPDGAH